MPSQLEALAAERTAAFKYAKKTGTLGAFREADWVGLARYTDRRKAAARAVVCPRCKASVGQLCRLPSGRSRTDGEHHDERHAAGVEADLLPRPPRWVDGRWEPGVSES